MKRIIVLFMALILLAVPRVTMAEKSKDQSLVAQEEAVKMKEEVEMVGKIFGVDFNDTKEKPKNWPEVVDKMLNMAGKLVSSIASTIEKVAPEVWSIMIRQQYAKAFGDMIPPLGLIIVCFVYRRTVSKLLPPEEDKRGEDYIDSDSERFTKKGWHGLFRTVVPYLIGFAAAIWLVIQGALSMKYVINPKYYAVRDIIIMILGQTHGTGT